MEKKNSVVSVGAAVVTVHEDVKVSDGLTMVERLARQWGAKGTVIKRHFGSCLYYEVRHISDKTIGRYSRSELKVV